MSDLDQLFDQVKAFKRPPINQWCPEKEVEIDIKIASDGRWFYQGSLIQRQRLVKLFSTLIRREDDQFFLITPPVKYQIKVEDAPFTAVELKCVGRQQDQKLYFRTNVDEVVLAGRHHPIRVEVDPISKQPIPYVLVRDGLRAKILRSVFYELVELLEPVAAQDEVSQSGSIQSWDADQEWGIFSDGVWFSFG